MKKIIILLVFISTSFCTDAQLLIKKIRPDIEYQPNPETMIGIEIKLALRKKFNIQSVPRCYAKVFYVKFELSDKGETNNIQVSAFMVDTVIINIIRQALVATEQQWDMEKCKKHNPSLKFLLPIYMDIRKKDCKLTYTISESYSDEDSKWNNIPIKDEFMSMLNYDSNNFKDGLRTTPSVIDEKFVGMVLSPTYVYNY